MPDEFVLRQRTETERLIKASMFGIKQGEVGLALREEGDHRCAEQTLATSVRSDGHGPDCSGIGSNSVEKERQDESFGTGDASAVGFEQG